ncbi:hypothetical protein B296_00022532 [Ensete ventricosum]|uniref:BHLH domain-containing protein n=1 Tax=Ensete ventricosum TaxID=4639 RepID=A0A426ZXU3_ENSVE|nr:hypothetical protein B296_00022532 [Ensete ventricosum]
MSSDDPHDEVLFPSATAQMADMKQEYSGSGYAHGHGNEGIQVRKEKLGDRITALHQLTDTASVLQEAIGYIRFLQSQIEKLAMTDVVIAVQVGVAQPFDSGVCRHQETRAAYYLKTLLRDRLQKIDSFGCAVPCGRSAARSRRRTSGVEGCAWCRSPSPCTSGVTTVLISGRRLSAEASDEMRLPGFFACMGDLAGGHNITSSHSAKPEG